MGREPDAYLWGSATYTVDNLPSVYIMRYNLLSGNLSIVIANDVTIEIRNENSLQLRCCGNLTIGLTPDQVFAIVGYPSQTIYGHDFNSGYDYDVFYPDMNETPGRHFYSNTAHGVRMFFMSGLTKAIYLSGTTDIMEMHP